MWGKRLVKSVLCLVAGAMMFSPGSAQAQFIGIPMGGFGFGNNMNQYGLYMRSYAPGYGRGVFPGFTPGVYGYGAGMNMTAYNPSMYNPLLYNSSYMGSFSGTLAFPGFSSNGNLARMRSSMYPALAVGPGSNAIKAAAYESDVESRARIEVTVPANAVVTLQGVTMTQTGTVRRYYSPPLEANTKFVYEIVVRWQDSAGEHSETRQVRVWAGAIQHVDFTAKQ